MRAYNYHRSKPHKLMEEHFFHRASKTVIKSSKGVSARCLGGGDFYKKKASKAKIILLRRQYTVNNSTMSNSGRRYYGL
jgi:hypothetical protein